MRIWLAKDPEEQKVEKPTNNPYPITTGKPEIGNAQMGNHSGNNKRKSVSSNHCFLRLETKSKPNL